MEVGGKRESGVGVSVGAGAGVGSGCGGGGGGISGLGGCSARLGRPRPLFTGG